MKGIIETVQDGGVTHTYRDLTKADIDSLFDNLEPQPYPEMEFYTSAKMNWKISHELKRWRRWELGCPTSMDIFIYKYDAKSRRRYKLKQKNKHPYARKNRKTNRS